MGKDQPYVPAKFSIPSEFCDDFRDSSTGSQEEIVQCCQFPLREKKELDNSTILVFERVPYIQPRDEAGASTNEPAAIPILNSQQTTLGNKPEDESQQVKLESSTVHLKAVQQHVNLGQDSHESYPENREPVPRTTYKYKKHLVTRYSEELEEENKQLQELVNIKFKNSSPDICQLERNILDLDINTSATNSLSSGEDVELKTRESHEQPYTTQENSERRETNRNFLFTPERVPVSEAWLKMKAISSNLEKEKKQNQGNCASSTNFSEKDHRYEKICDPGRRISSRSAYKNDFTFSQVKYCNNSDQEINYCTQKDKNSELPKKILKQDNSLLKFQKDSFYKKENKCSVDDISDISFSSEFSFTSGYRSSHLDNSSESETDSCLDNENISQEDYRKGISEEVVSCLLKDVIDSAVTYSGRNTMKHLEEEKNQKLLMKEKIKLNRKALTCLYSDNKTENLIKLPSFDNKEKGAEYKLSNAQQILYKTTSKLQQQDSVESSFSQNSAGLPDLESIGVKTSNKKYNCKDFLGDTWTHEKCRFVFLASDGRVLAESSKGVSDYRDCCVRTVGDLEIDNGYSGTDSIENTNDVLDKLKKISKMLEQRKTTKDKTNSGNVMKAPDLNKTISEKVSVDEQFGKVVDVESPGVTSGQNSSFLFVDRRGRILAGSNRNSIDGTKCVKKVRSKLLSGSLPSIFSKDSSDMIDSEEDDHIEDNTDWQKLKAISSWIDSKGPSLL
eukprot:GFUD01038210.1.p1 GENE.GFUD01038210.1~~GFUD01038210.1.p1  ORF type:complete len:732 (+),score=187.01 GFUD01038210.1:284-2479(+)